MVGRENIDQAARDMARHAISLVEAHERVCAERAREAATWRTATTDKLADIESAIGERLTNMGRAIGGVYNRLWLSAVSLIGVLLTVCAYLIVHHGL